MSVNIKSPHVGAAMLPRELWVQVISHLDSKNVIRALCTCKALSSLKEEAWKAACYRRWPFWSLIADGAEAEWRRVYELLELRESEQAVRPDVKAIRKRQTVINERHRGILAEWLYEVRTKYLSRSFSIDCRRQPHPTKNNPTLISPPHLCRYLMNGTLTLVLYTRPSKSWIVISRTLLWRL